MCQIDSHRDETIKMWIRFWDSTYRFTGSFDNQVSPTHPPKKCSIAAEGFQLHYFPHWINLIITTKYILNKSFCTAQRALQRRTKNNICCERTPKKIAFISDIQQLGVNKNCQILRSIFSCGNVSS